METDAPSKFNNIIKEIINKSLFTERQIEIILSSQRRWLFNTPISRGAYYRQISQSKVKLERFVYTMMLIYGIGIIPVESLDVIQKVAKEINVMFESDIDIRYEKEVLSILEKAVEGVILSQDM